MIKQNKQGRWVVECAKCKTAAMDPRATVAEALENAERCHGYIVFGKFQFCAECLNAATERWKANNRELLEAMSSQPECAGGDPLVPKKRGRPKKVKPEGVSISPTPS